MISSLFHTCCVGHLAVSVCLSEHTHWVSQFWQSSDSSCPSWVVLLFPAFRLLHNPISLSDIAALGFLIALFCHLFTVDPLTFLYVLYRNTSCVFEQTHSRTHSPSRTPNIPLRSDEMLRRMSNVWRYCCHWSLQHLKAKNTLTLADNNRPTV